MTIKVNQDGEEITKLTHSEEVELEKHAIASYWKYRQRMQGTGQIQQPAKDSTEIDQDQCKVILNNVNGRIAEACYSYKNGKFRCRWIA